MQVATIYIINMRLYLIIKYENNSGKNMPEYKLRDNRWFTSTVIYFTDSFLALHIDCKGNIFFCIYFKNYREVRNNPIKKTPDLIQKGYQSNSR